MHFSLGIFVALAATYVTAQDDFSQVISSRPELSNFTTYLDNTPELRDGFNRARNVTILAPSDDSFKDLISTNINPSDPPANSSLIDGILTYHLINGTYRSADISTEPKFLKSFLDNPTFENVRSGQVVKAVKEGEDVKFISGLLADSTVTTPDIEFNGGVIHIVDEVLTLPQIVSATALATNMTTFVKGMEVAGSTVRIDSTEDVTVFIPTNDAFSSIGSALENATTMKRQLELMARQGSNEQIANIVNYHAVEGTVLYSSDLKNESMPTMAGKDVTITVVDGVAYVNSARVVGTDVLTNNGVIHIIDNVLNPDNTTASANPSSPSGEPAFGGASQVPNEPLTSGASSPTSAIEVPTAAPVGGGGGGEPSPAPPGQTTPAGAAPMETAAVGIAAILGVGAILVNA
ncbi:hypothetical protein FQN54_006522 [Arachnomyces sp. PD_36]|nr:hypothetical protein FQN54_006522 [Arachnomyces sp. PD_36]